MLAPRGDIDVFVRAVGHSPSEGNPASAEVLSLLPSLFKVQDLEDEYGDDSAYWIFHEFGAIFLWGNHVLISVTLFVQGSMEEDCGPYPRRLFEAFGNDVTRQEVEKKLGVPDSSGVWNGEWICYDNVNETELRFEFDENDRLWSVGVTMKGWENF